MSAKATTVDAVVEAITEGIKHGRYAAGQRLVEADLSRELGVSRGPLREAFGRLAADGLLVIEPYRGALVRRMSRADLIDLFQVREALEGQAARLAAERIHLADHRERLQRALDDVRAHREEADVAAYMDVNERFHQLIVELSGNQALARMIAQLQIQAFRLLYRRLADSAAKTHSIEEHEHVAAAILDRDAAAAEREMRAHVRSSAESALRSEAWEEPRPLGAGRTAQ
jgi:DNA-binding GntR family transcriptional regulator